jgi:hypothetical protein
VRAHRAAAHAKVKNFSVRPVQDEARFSASIDADTGRDLEIRVEVASPVLWVDDGGAAWFHLWLVDEEVREVAQSDQVKIAVGRICT